MGVPTVVIVGGFLGSGKTTLILKTADMLRQVGKRAAIILNDQDAGLVDTEHALAREASVREIVDGCFCCRFSDFIAAAHELAAQQPDVIFAEPVGSCADLSATVIRPLGRMYGDRLPVAPLTVLLDPSTAEARLAGSGDADMSYLALKQIAEADIVCTTRRDLYPMTASLPIPIDFQVSGITGDGVAEWLREVLEPTRVAGARPLDIDYTRYGEAEAALGWLNLHARIELTEPQSPALLCGPLLDELHDELTGAGIPIAHLKVFDRASTGWVKASICGNGSEAIPEGDLLAESSRQHELALNLRAVAGPEVLERLTRAAVGQLHGEIRITHLRAFRPPAPKPEYREPVTILPNEVSETLVTSK